MTISAAPSTFVFSAKGQRNSSLAFCILKTTENHKTTAIFTRDERPRACGLESPHSHPDLTKQVLSLPAEEQYSFIFDGSAQVLDQIFDTSGREDRTLTDAQYKAGYHSVRWDGKDKRGNPVASGVYLYKLQAGNFSDVKKLSLIR
jgi:hypothetical protein